MKNSDFKYMVEGIAADLAVLLSKDYDMSVYYSEDFEILQKNALIEQPLSAEQKDCSQSHKFYYHICKDIL